MDEEAEIVESWEHFLKESEKEIPKQNPKVTLKEEKTLTIETEAKPKAEEKTEITEYQFRRNLERFKELVNIIEGRTDVKRRLDAILNPDNIQTSTRLTDNEVDFVADAYWLAKTFPKLFMPLKDFADELMCTKISEHGLGRMEAIQFVGAMETSKLFKAVFGSGMEKAKEKHRFKLFGQKEEGKNEE